MNVLELSDPETAVLRLAIETRLREMREELTHTDDRAFRDAFKKDVRLLERVGRAIGANVPEERLSTPPPMPH